MKNVRSNVRAADWLLVKGFGVGDVARLDTADVSARGGRTVHSEFTVPDATVNNIIGGFGLKKRHFQMKFQ